MIGNKLRHNIDIYGDTNTRDALGSITSTSSLIASVKADINISIGKASSADDTIINQTEATFYIRNYPTVTYNNYIVYQNDKYKILAIQPMLDRTGQTIKAVRNG